MIQSAIELGVTQKQLEDEFFMVDLPLILEEKRKREAIHALQQIMIITLPYSSSEESKQTAQQFISGLREVAGAVEELPEGPDLEGLAKLKSLLSRK